MYVINKQGKLLKYAFELKANQDLSLEIIAERVTARGWKIDGKKLSNLFQNPFYCGFIVSSMLLGEMIKGNHPKLISQSTFLKVHENLEKFGKGSKIDKQTEELPLKQFLECFYCGNPLTGYQTNMD